VYGAFNCYAGPDKSISLWTYNGHEGGGIIDEERAITFVNAILQTIPVDGKARPAA
jgi:cephalosporin-C deacetylase